MKALVVTPKATVHSYPPAATAYFDLESSNSFILNRVYCTQYQIPDTYSTLRIAGREVGEVDNLEAENTRRDKRGLVHGFFFSRPARGCTTHSQSLR